MCRCNLLVARSLFRRDDDGGAVETERCRHGWMRDAACADVDAGVIEGYQARINGAALDLGMTVIVHIGLKSQTEDVLDAFEKAVVKAPSIVSCYLMSGEDDYLLTVMARDLPDFERIYKEQLSRLPGVARMKSSFALRDVARKGLRDLLRS